MATTVVAQTCPPKKDLLTYIAKQAVDDVRHKLNYL